MQFFERRSTLMLTFKRDVHWIQKNWWEVVALLLYEEKKIFFLIPINVSDMLTNKRKELIKIGIYKLL